MNLAYIFVIAGLVCAILSVFTRVPLWLAVVLMGIGLVFGVAK